MTANSMEGDAEKADAADRAVDPTALHTLLNLVGGERKALNDLITSYIDESGLLLRQVDTSAGNDADTLRRVAHTLKSLSCDFGLKRIADISSAIELRARDGDAIVSDSELRELKDTHAKGVEVLRSMMEKA